MSVVLVAMTQPYNGPAFLGWPAAAPRWHHTDRSDRPLRCNAGLSAVVGLGCLIFAPKFTPDQEQVGRTRRAGLTRHRVGPRSRRESDRAGGVRVQHAEVVHVASMWTRVRLRLAAMQLKSA